MATLAELKNDVKSFFRHRIKIIRFMYFSVRHTIITAIAFGGLAALIFQHPVFLIIGSIGGALFSYFYADSYLCKLDAEYFNTSQRSQREIFNKYYSKIVEQNLGLRLTEPSAIQAMSKMSNTEMQSYFKERLQQALELEFNRFQWRYFVAQALFEIND